MCLSSLPFISFHYLFILPTITPSSCLRSHCLALFCLPLSVHLISQHSLILFLIIPSSYFSLSLHLVPSFCRCQYFLTMCWVWSKVVWLFLLLDCKVGLFCCWVAKLGYIIILLRILNLVYPSYWKNHIPQQWTREDSNPTRGETPPLPLKGNSVLLAPKISETITRPIQ